MVKFKSIYKSEYSKILEDYESEKEEKTHYSYKTVGSEGTYVFNSKVSKEYTDISTRFSGRTRNKNERFENELICKE